MIHKCFNCGKEFETPLRLPAAESEFWGKPATEYSDCCPYCKLDDISEIKFRCDYCNFAICEGDTYYELEDGSVFCDSCITKKEA